MLLGGVTFTILQLEAAMTNMWLCTAVAYGANSTRASGCDRSAVVPDHYSRRHGEVVA